MPVLGIGMSQIKEEDACEKWVQEAFEAGYRMIDTASAYQNEEIIGRAIKKSGIPREQLFVTTKLWIQDNGYENTKKAIQKSLERLEMSYLDLYLIHQPIGDVHGSWRAMEEAYHAGKIRTLGVSNFEMDRLTDLMLFHDIKPAVNQLETHPLCQQADAQNYMKTVQVQLQAWGPFAGGKDLVLQNRILCNIARDHGKTAAQVILRWLIQKGMTVIFGTGSKEHLAENMEIFDFSLTEQEMFLISSLDTRQSILINYHLPETVITLGQTKFNI